MKVKLRGIASVQFGYYEKPGVVGRVKYLQAKHFNEYSQFIDEVDDWVDIDDKNESHLLQNGDVLFVGKGSRNFAAVYTWSYGLSIASSIFYVIRIKNQEKFLPEFLCLLFNSSAYQAQLQSLGAGSSILSIRKQELEDLNIEFPSIEKQRELIRLSSLHQEEMQIYNKIIHDKQLLVQQIINDLIKE